MAFNYKLAKEIYGLTPWCVDINTLPLLMNIISKNGDLEVPEIKYNTPQIYDIKSETRLIQRGYQLNNNDQFDGIGLIVIDGPITRSGGASSYGMTQISSMMSEMAQDDRIKGFIILADSGGGSATAVELMVDTINEIKKTKPVYGLVVKGGMAASAMYGIISACDKIFSESGMNIVGSAGTMIQFEGRAANSQDKDGNKYIRLYATKSKKKNQDFEEALNNDNYQVMIDDMLDPYNENFLNIILSNRPQLEGTNFDDGRDLFSKDAVGTYIDGIKSFNEVVLMMVDDINSRKSSSNSNNINLINSRIMTVEQLKNEHPATYNAIFNDGKKAGVSAEKDRCGVWLAHFSTDPESVKSGIESGEELTASQREAFLVKSHSKTRLENLEKDGSQAILSPESTGKEVQVSEVDNFYANVKKEL